MTSKRVSIQNIGQVRTINILNNQVRITIECPDIKTAVYYESNINADLPQVWEWIYVEAWGEVNSGKSDDTLIYKPYYHVPLDGTHKDQWKFMELRDFKFIRIPPRNLMNILESLSERIKLHIDHWTSTNSEEQLSKTLEIVNQLQSTMELATRIASRINIIDSSREKKPYL
jgi:hypothetical protein